mmetsp:Transcript_21030/g.44831  ORF Transcript_21030/g.44831 Transcript_21030/m.44831 type:complete len:245 (-) Transcript_21030:62-796(-)
MLLARRRRLLKTSLKFIGLLRTDLREELYIFLMLPFHPGELLLLLLVDLLFDPLDPLLMIPVEALHLPLALLRGNPPDFFIQTLGLLKLPLQVIHLLQMLPPQLLVLLLKLQIQLRVLLLKVTDLPRTRRSALIVCPTPFRLKLFIVGADKVPDLLRMSLKLLFEPLVQFLLFILMDPLKVGQVSPRPFDHIEPLVQTIEPRFHFHPYSSYWRAYCDRAYCERPFCEFIAIQIHSRHLDYAELS